MARLNETIATYDALILEANQIAQSKEDEIQHILGDTNLLMEKLNELDVGVEFTAEGPRWYTLSEMPADYFTQ